MHVWIYLYKYIGLSKLYLLRSFRVDFTRVFHFFKFFFPPHCQHSLDCAELRNMFPFAVLFKSRATHSCSYFTNYFHARLHHPRLPSTPLPPSYNFLAFFTNIHLHLVVRVFGNRADIVANAKARAHQSQHDVLDLSAELLNSRSCHGFSSIDCSSTLDSFSALRVCSVATRFSFVVAFIVVRVLTVSAAKFFNLQLPLRFTSTSNFFCALFFRFICNFFAHFLRFRISILTFSPRLAFRFGFGFGSHQFFKLFA